LIAYVAMSNHLHLVVRAPKDNLPEAMQFLLSKIARATNAIRNRRGPVWSDRYHAQVILDDDALFDRVCTH
jgi:REP element-mobilizing transposase RayT